MEFFIVANYVFIPMEFAKNGTKNPIQKVRQVGQQAQDMTWNDGTPNITLTAEADGGLPPKGQDFNGVVNAISTHSIFSQNGNRYKFDPSVVSEFGGYEKDAIIQSNDGSREYISLVDNNTNDPNIGGVAGVWAIYSGSGSIPSASSTTSGIMTVINSLNSTAVNSALSAAQGKAIADSFSSLRQANGYQRMFGGLIMQWGVVDFTSNPSEIPVNVTFPIPFPNSSLNIQLTRKAIDGNESDGVVNLISQTNTGFRAYFNTWSAGVSGLRGFTWFAIGH